MRHISHLGMNHYCFWSHGRDILSIAGPVIWWFFFNSWQPINYRPKTSCTISWYNCTHLKLYDSWNTPGICNVSTTCINFYQQQSQTTLAYGFRCYIWRVIALQCIQRTLQPYLASYVTQYMQRATAMLCNVYKGRQLCHTMHAIGATAMSHNICSEQQL